MTDKQYQDKWGRIWTIWLAVVAVSFAILETIGLAKKAEGDTLSENTRRWLGISKGKRLTVGAVVFSAALVAFVAWFQPHIVWETW